MRWDDRVIELFLAKLLRAGVVLAAMIVAAGGILYLAKNGGGHPEFSRFIGEPSSLTSVGAIVNAALQMQSRAIIQLGLLVLIATPIARVLFSLVAFTLQRDRLYIAITLIVLVILGTSLLAGG